MAGRRRAFFGDDAGDTRRRLRVWAWYSVYDGWQLRGRPRFVIGRGQVLLADGELTARPGQGQWLRRG